MLTNKQNFIETLKQDGHPDRLVNQYEAQAFMPGDPMEYFVRGTYTMGMEPKKDVFGTELIWPDGYVAVMPHITEENKVIKDITNWRNEVKIPDMTRDVDSEEQWAPFLERVAQVPREKLTLMPFMHTGVFERLHFLMGFEDLFCNMYEEPEALKELCDAIGDYRLGVMKTLVKHVHPDLVMSHDDWGSKTNLFMNPDMWREFIKPQYKKIYDYLKSEGILIMHHADSFLEPIVMDMAELGIDVWQGALPSNDILKLSEQLDGRMAIMGGLEMGIIDAVDSTEETVRAETRRVLETYGHLKNFIPCITYGGPGTFYPERYDWITDEINKWNLEHYGVCSEPYERPVNLY